MLLTNFDNNKALLKFLSSKLRPLRLELELLAEVLTELELILLVKPLVGLATDEAPALLEEILDVEVAAALRSGGTLPEIFPKR